MPTYTHQHGRVYLHLDSSALAQRLHNKQIVLKEEIIIPEQVYEICEKLGIERRNVEAILRGEA